MNAAMAFLTPLSGLVRRRIPDRSPIGIARTYPGTICLLATIVLCGLVTWGQPWEAYEPNVLSRLALQETFTVIDGDARIIADARRRTGEPVEQRRLAGVRVAEQNNQRPFCCAGIR